MIITLATIIGAIVIVGLLATMYVVAPRARVGTPVEESVPQDAPERAVYRELYGQRSLTTTKRGSTQDGAPARRPLAPGADGYRQDVT